MLVDVGESKIQINKKKWKDMSGKFVSYLGNEFYGLRWVSVWWLFQWSGKMLHISLSYCVFEFH